MKARARDVLAIALLLLAGAALTRCGGEPFSAGAVDAGEDLVHPVEELHQVDAGGDELELHQVDAGDELELRHDAGDELELHQVDAGDAGAVETSSVYLDASRDAPPAPSLCCHIACGSGTLPPDAGWTCVGPCTVGGSCSFMTACGIVVVCP